MLMKNFNFVVKLNPRKFFEKQHLEKLLTSAATPNLKKGRSCVILSRGSILLALGPPYLMCSIVGYLSAGRHGLLTAPAITDEL